MKVIGLDGKSYTLSLYGAGQPRHYASNLHTLARTVIKETFPTFKLMEEISLPGTGGLSCDFLIPQLKLVIEVQGEQHYKFSKLFHANEIGLVRQQQRDKQKSEWMEMNNFVLVEFPYNETKEQWKQRLNLDNL